MKKLISLMALVLAFSGVSSASAGISVLGGANFSSGDANTAHKSTGFNYGGELTFDLVNVELGGFYQHYGFPYEASGIDSDSANFYGAVARVGLGVLSSLFFDARVGLTKTSTLIGSTDNAFGFGVGLGYSFPIAPTLSLRPRVGYNNLPAKITGSSGTVGRTVIDADLMLTLAL